MVFDDSLPNHTLAVPFNVVGKALHMISSGTPWRCMVVLNVAMWLQGSHVLSYESKVGILNLEGRGWLMMDAIKGESVLWMRSSTLFCSSQGVLHLLYGSLNLIHLSLQVWHSTSDSTSRMISSLSAIFNPFILWILPILLTMALSSVSVNFSS